MRGKQRCTRGVDRLPSGSDMWYLAVPRSAITGRVTWRRLLDGLPLDGTGRPVHPGAQSALCDRVLR